MAKGFNIQQEGLQFGRMDLLLALASIEMMWFLFAVCPFSALIQLVILVPKVEPTLQSWNKPYCVMIICAHYRFIMLMVHQLDYNFPFTDCLLLLLVLKI